MLCTPSYSVCLLVLKTLPSAISRTMSDPHLPAGLNFKKSNIRIWIHQRNMANLQQVIWEGHGAMLLVEHSNKPKMKKFLEAVPHIMVSDTFAINSSFGFQLTYLFGHIYSIVAVLFDFR